MSSIVAFFEMERLFIYVCHFLCLVFHIAHGTSGRDDSYSRALAHEDGVELEVDDHGDLEDAAAVLVFSDELPIFRGKSGENANKYYKNRVYYRISTLLQNICVTLHTLFKRIHTMDRPINRIKVMLAEKRKSNKWLSEALGVAPTTVSKWCTNNAQPPMETFMKIAKLLEVDINELLRFDELEIPQNKD